jgi:hypothetical protein
MSALDIETPVSPLSFSLVPPVKQDSESYTRKKKIHCKQELIVSSLQKFYAGRNDMKEILPILQGTSGLSLRLVDWFVTNYAKKHNTGYILEGQEFLVYMNYKSQLKAYSKKLFDPFCRRERIMFQVPGEEPFVTTVGKLNFFRWAIEKGVLTYLTLHGAAIEAEMNKAMKDQNKARSSTASSQSSTQSTDSLASAITLQSTSSKTSVSSTSSARSTRRRNPDKELAAAKLMQKHNMEIELRFD